MSTSSRSDAIAARLPAAERDTALPPLPPGALPVVGHAPRFLPDPHRFGRAALDICGPVFSVKLPFAQTIVMNGPEAHRFFFAAKDDELSMSDFFKFVPKVFYGPTFRFDEATEFPFSEVKAFRPLLLESRMRLYAAEVEAEAAAFADELVARAKTGEPIPFVAVAKQLLLRLSTRCFLGAALPGELMKRFNEFFLRMDGLMGFGAIAASRVGLSGLTGTERMRRAMVRIVVEALESGSLDDRSLIGVLAKHRHPEGRLMTPDEVTGLSLQFLFAAHTPASVALSWTMLCLLREPAWLERARTEPEAADWCLQEGLRLHPPTTFHARIARKELVYDRFRIPKKALVLILPKLAHSLPELFPEPDRFDPSRFGPERREFAKQPFSLINFGGGPHHCVGKAFAMLQMRAALMALLARFDFEAVDKDVRPQYAGMVMLPKGPCRMRLTPRG